MCSVPHLGDEALFRHGGPENMVQVNGQNVQEALAARRSHL